MTAMVNLYLMQTGFKLRKIEGAPKSFHVILLLYWGHQSKILVKELALCFLVCTQSQNLPRLLWEPQRVYNNHQYLFKDLLSQVLDFDKNPFGESPRCVLTLTITLTPPLTLTSTLTEDYEKGFCLEVLLSGRAFDRTPPKSSTKTIVESLIICRASHVIKKSKLPGAKI